LAYGCTDRLRGRMSGSAQPVFVVAGRPVVEMAGLEPVGEEEVMAGMARMGPRSLDEQAMVPSRANPDPDVECHMCALH
jgi:hypothetical protein